MSNKVKQYITSVLIHVFTVVNIVGLPPLLVNTVKPSSYVLYASSSDAGSVIVKIKGEHVAPERITDLVATPRLVSGFYPGEELGGRVELVWTAPKDPEVYDVHPDTYVFSYIIKYDTSTRGYDLGYLDQLWQWWHDAQKVFSNHIWQLPLQAKGQTFEPYPLGFGIPAPEEKYRLTYGITDKIIVTGLPKGEKIWIGVSSRDRYYNQSTPTVVETYVPAGVEPPSKVTDLYATYGGVSTVQLTWTSPANDRFSVDASSGLYNIPDGRYCIAYSTVLPQTLDISPQDIPTKWPEAQVLYIDTSTLCFVPQVYKVTGLSLIEVSTSVGYYFLLWTSDEWLNKTNWSKRSNLAGFGLVAPDYVRDVVAISSASVDPQKGSYAILTWRNPKDEDIPLDGVKIYYSTRDYTTQENYFVKYTTTPNELVTTEHYQLLPRHWYYYILLSYNMAGSRPWTTDVIAKIYTSDDFIPPDKVSNLTGLADVSDTEGVYVKLNWTLPDGNLYQNKDYYIDGRIEVLYSTTSFSGPFETKVLPPTQAQLTLTGLIPYVTYYINVITADGGNNKSTSTISIYTPYDPYAPGAPKLFSYEVLSSTDENIGSYVKFDLKNPSDPDIKEVRIYFSTTGWVKQQYISLHETRPLVEYTTYVYQLYPRVTYYFIFVTYDVTNRYSYDVRQEVYIDKDTLAPEPPYNIQLIADAKPESLPYGSYILTRFEQPDKTKYRNFDLARYEVYASSTISPPYEDVQSIHVSTTSNIIELLHLEQHTTYYITIHSVDEVGNKSTSTVFTIFTLKDLVPPKLPYVKITTYTISELPTEGVSLTLKSTLPEDVDLDHAVVELATDKTFSIVYSSISIPSVRPLLEKEVLFSKLDVLTTYYFRIKVYDWSGNISVSTVSYTIIATPDDTIPLYTVGVKLEKKDNKLLLQWSKVRHQYNVTKNIIEQFKGINNLGPHMPTTFELYKYKVLYKQNLFDDTLPWVEVAMFTPEVTSCELPLVDGYYKIVSYDITGNKDESIIVDTQLNYYIYKNGLYVKLPQLNGETVANNMFYYDVIEYPEETKGRILKVIEPKLATLDEQQGKFVYKDYYKFDYENIVGVRYKVENGKAKFVTIDKYIEVDADKVATQVAFYVYDGKEYVRATTYVDKEKQIVYFLTKYFSKVQLRRTETTGEFNFVEAKPKVITPDSSPGENDVVFFVFNNPNLAEVKIRIYDINSMLVWEKTTNNDSSVPGSYISWDGKNYDGKYVQPGVYVYQVEAEGKKYKGTIVVAR